MSPRDISRSDRIQGGLWGALVGDALGVPVEFKNRPQLQSNPVEEMTGFGTHHQPPGTWSDDGALILCTVESLLQTEFDTEDLGRRFVQWMNQGLWTAHGEVFDVGLATTEALNRIARGTPAEQAGGDEEFSNGNGSLMRILPVALRFTNAPIKIFADRLERASSVTHRHPRSKMACVFYGLVVRQLLLGKTIEASLEAARGEFAGCYEGAPEFPCFKGLMEDSFLSLDANQISSSGYVLHTLHASIWTLLTTSDYKSCVLKAVNLGGDTDTTGCVTGELAGVHYGVGSIPEKWRRGMARPQEVDLLFRRFLECGSPAPD